jgi:hypothetical protein
MFIYARLGVLGGSTFLELRRLSAPYDTSDSPTSLGIRE